ncbi:vacuolar ATP synthase subunit H [Coccomyxa subellipsoidea C-169]|uniref:V-type proton ATPase subunit H n=1 Tax=Coccomyxa subellipsoidea (strain C-169) TaxID=574566 RepID=I0YTE8_COCSC|nr:vacuolar ATP synthase subunit H [Coccomyxa subellipsoidea C-169]EIE21667.1 vacuolar ATP synthase subunit H [Coccomyxa subellipsoidea C-169]|eukprot:XP_005646211.1 vacuolar ATP synthase subunit H [Coccomyxa subellipsoidea C-169]
MANFGEESSELTTASVLKRNIAWDTYLTARLITDHDLQLIRRYDKKNPEIQQDLLQEEGPAYAEAFFNVLRSVTKEDTVQYVLAILDEMVAGDPKRAAYFHQQSNPQKPSPPDPYTQLTRMLQRTDWFTQEKAATMLTAILAARPNRGTAETPLPPLSEAVQNILVTFVDWLTSQLRRPSHPGRSVPLAVGCLARLLREPAARALFTRASGASLLAPLLRGAAGAGSSSGQPPPSAQLLYEAGLCVWQLTFYAPASQAMASASIVPSLVDLARHASKEKVVRVALLALQNLLAAPGLDLAPEMVEAALPKVVQQRLLQNWEDEDVTAALEALKEALAANIKLLSSWDKYKKEVLSGSLDWSPMHTSDLFWLENAPKFEERDFQVLRVLLKLLEQSRENRTLAVAASDLGHFISAHPHGRNIVTDLRGKELAMRLMMHPDAEVQKQALLAVQKILLAKDKVAYLNN